MRLPVLAFAAMVLLPAGAQSVSSDVKQAPTGHYAVQPAHTLVLFSIFHQGTTNYYGRFDRTTGTLNFDAAEPDKSALTIQIDTSTIDTPSAALNTHRLKLADVPTGFAALLDPAQGVVKALIEC